MQSHTGMMDAGAKVLAGTLTARDFLIGELAFITATTNNESVLVDFASWARKSDGTGLILGNVTTPSGPTYGEAVYMALEEPDGTVRVALRDLSATSILDSRADLTRAYGDWQAGLRGDRPVADARGRDPAGGAARRGRVHDVRPQDGRHGLVLGAQPVR